MAPDAKDSKIVAEVKKMNVLTPYAVATRYGVRISAAKDFLEQLRQTVQYNSSQEATTSKFTSLAE